MDSYIRSALSKVMFDHLRDSDRYLSHPGHKPSRSGSPREYVATEPVALVLVTASGDATIARVGESTALRQCPSNTVLRRRLPSHHQLPTYHDIKHELNNTTHCFRVALGLYFGHNFLTPLLLYFESAIHFSLWTVYIIRAHTCGVFTLVFALKLSIFFIQISLFLNKYTSLIFY